jgi:predicted alpha/beta-hydrolase family hydrolase
MLVIGKSLASLLTGWARERELPAVWLTPLLGAPAAVDGLAGTRRPALLVGGTADPSWEPVAIPRHPLIEVLEIPDVDHSLQARGDTERSLDALRQMTGTVSRFIARL